MDNDPRLFISAEVSKRNKRKERANRNKDLQEMVLEIDEEGKNLSDWEINFIGGMVDNDTDSFSDKQEKIIRRIYGNKL